MDQSQPPPIKPRPQSKSEQLPTAAGQGQSRRMPTEEADDNLYDVIADDISPTTSSSGVMYFTREAALKSNSVLPMRKQRTRRSAAQRRQLFFIVIATLAATIGGGVLIGKRIQALTQSSHSASSTTTTTTTTTKPSAPLTAAADTTSTFLLTTPLVSQDNANAVTGTHKGEGKAATDIGTHNHNSRNTEPIKFKSTRGLPSSSTTTHTDAEIASKMYAGYVSMTTSGRVCQKWVKQVPHTHTYSINSYFSYDGEQTTAARNYCRDPLSNGYLWCFTTDPAVRWDICNVDLQGPHVNLCASVTCPQGTLCQQVNNTHHKCVCEVQALGSYSPTVLTKCLKKANFQSNVSKTLSRETCLPWISQNVYDASYFQADGTLEAAKNYCRYVDQDYLWCYTSLFFSYGHCYNDLCGVDADPCNANAGLR